MKKRIVFLMIGVLAVVSVQAQFAKPLKKKSVPQRVFSLGITGSYAANNMVYSTVTKSATLPLFVPTYGIAAEWNTMQQLSVGMDVSYVSRGGNMAFDSEVLTSYSSSTFSRIRYSILLNGIELRIPIAVYFGSGDRLKPYIYIAPRLNVWTGGHLRWEHIYDDASYQPMSFESELTDAMVQPFDLSAETGVGLCNKVKLGQRPLFIKFELGYGINVMSNFSQGEVNETVAFVGWGDIEHEQLGQRRLQNIEARLTLLMSLQKPVADACDFNQKPSKPK